MSAVNNELKNQTTNYDTRNISSEQNIGNHQSHVTKQATPGRGVCLSPSDF